MDLKNYFLLLFLSWSYLFGQGGNLSFTSTQPSNTYVCGEAKTFTVNISNTSAGGINNPIFTVVLPQGFEYVPGTITNATESDITVLDSVIFTMANISASSTVNITFQAIVKCAAIALVDNDIDIQNKYRVDYDFDYDAYVTPIYDVFRPSLVYVSITNQTYSGLVGDVFTRTLTIKNTGDGKLSSFTLDDTHGAGIQINSMSPGTFNNIGLTGKLVLGSTEFAIIGNNDGFLDPNEEIIITESITILACNNLTSNYQMYWGCNAQTCATTVQNGNVTIQNGVTAITHAQTNSHNVCYGGSNVSVQQLRFSNTGTETARDIEIYIYQGYGGGVIVNNYYSRIDADNIQYKVGNNNPWQPLTPTVTTNNSNYACFGVAQAKSGFKYTFPILQPGDTIYVRWDVYTCCQSTCNQNQSMNGWEYEIKWKNQCLSNNFQITPKTARFYSSLQLGGQTITGQPDISDGQTNVYNLVNSGISLYPSNTANDRIIVTLTLPAGIGWGGLLTLVNSNLVNFPPIGVPTVTVSGGITT
ncbi:MAG: hypothetical protein ACK4ON_09965, partial [Bacteroidia bacterium]